MLQPDAQFPDDGDFSHQLLSPRTPAPLLRPVDFKPEALFLPIDSPAMLGSLLKALSLPHDPSLCEDLYYPVLHERRLETDSLAATATALSKAAITIKELQCVDLSHGEIREGFALALVPYVDFDHTQSRLVRTTTKASLGYSLRLSLDPRERILYAELGWEPNQCDGDRTEIQERWQFLADGYKKFSGSAFPLTFPHAKPVRPSRNEYLATWDCYTIRITRIPNAMPMYREGHKPLWRDSADEETLFPLEDSEERTDTLCLPRVSAKKLAALVQLSGLQLPATLCAPLLSAATFGTTLEEEFLNALLSCGDGTEFVQHTAHIIDQGILHRQCGISLLQHHARFGETSLSLEPEKVGEDGLAKNIHATLRWYGSDEERQALPFAVIKRLRGPASTPEY